MTRLILIAAAALFSTPAAAASRIEGQWTNPARSVTVRIAPCGRALCGHVVSATPSARAKAAAAGTPRLVGTELMSGLTQIGEAAWRGHFFVPDRNLRAPGELHWLGPRTIEIEGCAVPGILCKTQQWSKVAVPRPVRRRR